MTSCMIPHSLTISGNLNELESIYSTLENDNTKLMIELGKIKSINVFFTGQIENPGINLIHPFSDVFSAIVQAGGINNDGSFSGCA